MRTINFYKTETNKIPVEDFLDSLTSKQAQKVTWVMQLVEQFEKVPKNYFKKLIGTDDVWEIRVELGSNIFRILGFFGEKNNFIATNGFQKKTQKTPINEIRLAEKRRSEYFKQMR